MNARCRALVDRKFLVLLAIGCCWASSGIHAAPPSPAAHQGVMVVVNKTAHSLTVYHYPPDKPVCTATVEINPHEVALSPDGSIAYLPVYGNSGVGAPGTDEHVLHFIRTSDCKDVAALDTGDHKRPHGIKVGPHGLIYLTAEIGQSLLVIDPVRRAIVAAIPTGSSTSHMVALSPDGTRAYTSNVQSKTISVLDLKNHKLLTQVPTGVENQRIAVSNDGSLFVTSLYPDREIGVYRASDDKLDYTVKVDGVPFVTAFSTDGKYLYAVGVTGPPNSEAVAWKIDLAQRKIVARLTGYGQMSSSILVAPGGKTVYITDERKSNINEIDAESWKLLKQIHTGNGADQMAVRE